MNYIDLIILLVLFLYVIDGWERGVRDKLWDLISFIISFLAALRLYSPVADRLTENLAISRHLAKSVSFALAAIVGSWILGKLPGLIKTFWGKIKGGRITLGILGTDVDHLIPPKVTRAASGTIALLDGLLFAALTLGFVVTFPLQPRIKGDIFRSQIGNFLVEQTAKLENVLTTVLGGRRNETLTFLTLPPIGTGISLGISLPETGLIADPEGELAVLKLFNRPAATGPLKDIEDLRQLAKEMLSKGDLFNPAIQEEPITGNYLIALAPSAATAMEGLRSIPEYRDMLRNTAKIVVGAVDSGPYGKLFIIKLK